ncbi:response regulator [Paenibacillus sp.]|uniref:response regulator n=1 Tax=Paenibacillus sp. TaxID=58172 RepID=UPI0028118C34|nr:response regulator [Paenibacillus sp.]
MKVIIIEDEADILCGMKEAVSQLGDRIELVFAVTQAEAALELIELHRPEIVVTDIVLPQMTGLDLMEQISAKDYHPKIIVVSGYSNFTYAQRSMKLGAIDYMLKPFAREEFIQKIGSVVEMVLEEKEIGKALQYADSNAMLGTKALRDKYLLGLCMNPVPLHEHTVHRLKFFDLEWLAGGAFSVIALDRAEDDKRPLPEKEKDLQLFAIGNIVEDLLGDYSPSVVFRNVRNQWIIVTGCEDLLAMTEAIGSNLIAYQRLKVSIGVSLRMNSFQAVAKAYEQAVQALRLSHLDKQGQRVFYSEIEALGLGERPQNDYDQIAEYIYLDQGERIRAAVTAVVNGFVVAAGANQRQELTQRCIEWIVHVHSLLADKLKIALKQISIQLWVDLDACESIEALRAHMIGYFGQLTEQIAAAPMNPIIVKALQRIQSGYSQNITLQSIASELATHPVWLSQLFKRETKQTFSDYLTGIRMEEAKRLLRESNLKVYEISEAVGYTDLQHFGQLFKKRVGQTPKEFRAGK